MENANQLENPAPVLNGNRNLVKTTSTERGLISFYYGSGKTISEISRLMRRSRPTVTLWIKRLTSGEEFEPKKQSVKRTMFTDVLKNQIREHVTAHFCSKLEEYINDIGINCKKSALCKELVKMDLRAYKAPKKELLKDSHVQIRLIKAQNWVNKLKL